MTDTIKYDKPIANYIDALSATGHVTHRKYKKKSVTLHHVEGNLTHQGLLNVWKKRPASAHFHVDGRGTVAQFVHILEYAWAVGSTYGNQTSVSIEMADESRGGDWPVAEVTWKEAARLTARIHRDYIGARPTKETLKIHKEWSSTDCPGPFVTRNYDKILAHAQKEYDLLVGGNSAPKPPVTQPVTPKPTPSTPAKKSLTQIAGEVWAGKWGNGEDRKTRLKQAGYDPAAVQKLVGQGVGKPSGQSSTPAPARKSTVEIAKEVIDGKWGNGEDRRARLAKAGYNATTIQMEVNRMVAPTTRKSIATLAKEVIDGKWGNGQDRQNRLTKAGYSYAQVQAEVNRQA